MKQNEFLDDLWELRNKEIESILEYFDITKSGNKLSKIERLYGFMANDIDEVINAMSYPVLVSFNEKNKKFSYNPISELRKKTIDYYCRSKDHAKQTRLTKLQADTRKFFSEMQLTTKTFQLTEMSKLSSELYLLEKFIEELKKEFNVNQYLNNGIYSDNIFESIKDETSSQGYHREYDYHFPILLYLFERLKKGKQTILQIELAKQFFEISEIKDKLSYPDIKIHKTGNTRCYSYFKSNIDLMDRINLINFGQNKYYGLTLFGIFVIDRIETKYMKNMSLSQKYNFAFSNNHIFEFYKDAKIENVHSFIESLSMSLPNQYKKKTAEYLERYTAIISQFIELKKDVKKDIITGLKIQRKDVFDKALKELIHIINTDEVYQRILVEVIKVKRNSEL